MNKKHLTRTLLLSAAFITACGEDNSTIPNSNDLPSEVANMNELATCNCNVDIIGRKVYVKDIAQNYECDGDHWFKSYDQPKSSASLLNPESSSNAISSSTTNKPLSSSDKAQSSSSVAPLSSGVASSSSIAPVGCQTCEYGTLTDERDGQTYKTVKIGEQVWMAENLNYNYDLGSAKSFCYEDDSINCDRYGRLYSWSAVMDSAGLFSTNGMGCGVKKECTPQYPIQGVCPEGWHVPNKEELLTLLEAVGGKQKENGYFWNNAGTALKSTSGWNDLEGNGTDAFGFSALPAGYLLYHLNLDNRMSYSKGDEGFIASSTQEEDFLSQAVFLILTSNDDIATISAFSKEHAASVRCLKGVGKLIGTGKLKDERDGQIYRTVKIGNQVWMAQNLNYAYNEPTTTQDSSSFCYGGDPANCTIYGRLYLWSAAMDSVGKFSTNGKGCGYGSKCSATGKVRGVCPSGWHLPSRDEVITLLKTVGGEQMPEKDWQWENAGKALKSVGGWNNINLDSGNGTDEFGFSAIPAGNWDYSGKFFNIGDELNIMTSSLKKNNSSDSYYLSLLNNESYASIYSGSSMDGQSVRCIMDEE
jgi:uncharacterized protein (TIGR02145 family)